MNKSQAQTSLGSMWYLLTVSFDHCSDIDIAIHESMITTKAATDCAVVDRSDEEIREQMAYRSQFGPGTLAASVDSTDLQDLFVDVNDAYSLVDRGYIRADVAHLIFKRVQV